MTDWVVGISKEVSIKGKEENIELKITFRNNVVSECDNALMYYWWSEGTV